ncbi:hypothetical protein [Streptomyces globisporus]
MIDDDSAVADGSEAAAPANLRAPYSERPVARARQAKNVRPAAYVAGVFLILFVRVKGTLPSG